MAKTVKILSEDNIKLLCGFIRNISKASDCINNTQLADDKVFSNLYTKLLLEQLQEDCNDYTDTIFGSMTHLTCEETNIQPTLDNAELNKIYLYSTTLTPPYQQYLKISDGTTEKLIDLGSTSISLSEYMKAIDIANTYTTKIETQAVVDTIGDTSDLETTAKDTFVNAINEIKKEIDTFQPYVELTKAEYEALSTEEQNNGTVYYITDMDSFGGYGIANEVDYASTANQIPNALATYNGIYQSIPHIINNDRTANGFMTALNEYSTNMINNTHYRAIINGYVAIPELGNTGGVFYIDGQKASELYEYQTATQYGATGAKIYGRSKVNGTWNTWKRCCMTSVDDVSETAINIPSNEYCSVVGSGLNWYYIKNGICYYLLYLQITKDISEWTAIYTGLPKPTKSFMNTTSPFELIGDNKALATYITYNGTLSIAKGATGNLYLVSGSYPVAE